MVRGHQKLLGIPACIGTHNLIHSLRAVYAQAYSTDNGEKP